MNSSVPMRNKRDMYKVLHLDGSGTKCPVLYYGHDRERAIRTAYTAEKAGKIITVQLVIELRATLDARMPTHD